jgi:hypothetical protein
MLWKLLGLQRKLDSLFDEGWSSLGFACNYGTAGKGTISNEKISLSSR